MTHVKPEGRARLIEALSQSDELVRGERADRIVWLSQHNMSPGIVVGRLEPMNLMQEASDSFVNGHFIACLLLAMAFIEHTVMDELVDASIEKQGSTFVGALVTAKRHKLIDEDLIDRVDTLRQRRNPYAHRKPPGHEYSLGTRLHQENIHPKFILEADAKEALELMYGFFRATLRAA
jgi:hypothetical protein